MCEVIPDFQNISMENIGPDNKKMIVGTAPKAENLAVKFNNWNKLCADYDYIDTDENHESDSKIKWYSSYTLDGDYVYTGVKGREFLCDTDGIYVRFTITPKDSFGIAGEIMYSETAYVSKGGGLVVKSVAEKRADGKITVNVMIENKDVKERTVLAFLYENSGSDVKKLVSCDSGIASVPAGKYVSFELTVPEGDGSIKTSVLSQRGVVPLTP